MKKYFTSIYEKLYRQEFLWVHARSSKEFMDILETKVSNIRDIIEADDELDECDGETTVINVDGKDIIVFWFNVEEPEAIVHELLHSVFRCMKARGITLSDDSEETYCYMLSFLYGEILKEIKPKKPLTKSKKVL